MAGLAGKRVLLAVGQYHPDYPSGANRLAYDEARFLVAQGTDIWLLVQDVEGIRQEHESIAGITVLRYKVPTLHRLDPRRARAHRTAIAALVPKYLQKADAIHGHAPLQYEAACALFPRARKVFSIHSPVTMEMALNWSGRAVSYSLRRALALSLLKRLERRCIERSDAVSAFSAYTRCMMDEIHGRALAGNIQVIPGWVGPAGFDLTLSKTAARQRLGWADDLPVFFTLRRLVPRMGLDTLLRAIARVRDGSSKFRLMIGGDGPLQTSLRQTAAALGLDDHVHFLGRLNESTLPLAYSACDAFVLPTAALECFGLIAIEALAAGRPVLATPVGAIPEILSKVEPRWLARSADEGAIAELLTEFLAGRLPAHDPSELRAVVEQEYRSENVIPRLTSLLFPLQQNG
jgi:glycosyltransferase involved in cell wall biosynthesis